MSAQERELVPDVFGDRGAFVLPQANEDIKQPRYLFEALNLITPQVARERPHMKSGGLNVYNPCLKRWGDFIRRGRITPLLVDQHMPIPVEEANTDDSSYYSIPLEGESLRGVDGPFAVSAMMSRAAYPGQQIVHILEGAPNIDGSGRRVGIVELTTLRGHEYKLGHVEDFLADPELWKIQRAIFPDYPSLPIKLAPFTELVKRAIDSNAGDIRSVAEEALVSCVQGESWAIWSVEQAHQNMAQAAAKGYIHPYEDIDLVILAQLGRERQDEHYKRTAEQAAVTAQASVDPVSLVALLRESGKENREMFMAGMTELLQEWKSDSIKPDDSLSVDKEEMMKIYARDVHIHGVEKVRAAATKGIYGDLHHKTRERIEREVAEAFTESEK